MSSNLKSEQKMERYQKGLPLLGRPRLLNVRLLMKQCNKKAENILKNHGKISTVPPCPAIIEQ